MKKGFYLKLAWTGIRKNKKLYLPYLLTCIGMVMMFYIVSFLSTSQVLREMKGGDTMQSMLMLGYQVIGVFALIFLFYTNSFLIRRRKTEFGLYNILGMGKRNLARVLLWESLIITVISLAAGLLSGMILSKFAELGMVNILQGDTTFSFHIEPIAIIQTLILFAVIFTLILLNTLRQIHLTNPIQLLHSENAGEKPPKANWFFALVGVFLLGCAYYLAVTIENPVVALLWFFVAVIMVIVATYLLFISGSVTICRMLQEEKEVLLSNKPFCFGFFHGIPYEKEWGGACFHLHPLYDGIGDGIQHRVPLCWIRRQLAHPLSTEYQSGHQGQQFISPGFRPNGYGERAVGRNRVGQWTATFQYPGLPVGCL